MGPYLIQRYGICALVVMPLEDTTHSRDISRLDSRYNSRDTTVTISMSDCHTSATPAPACPSSQSLAWVAPLRRRTRARRHPPRRSRNTGSLRPSATPLSVRYTVGLLCPRLPAQNSTLSTRSRPLAGGLAGDLAATRPAGSEAQQLRVVLLLGRGSA